MTEQEILAENLLLFRKQNNLTQEEMADECGISKETLSLIERGKHNPTLHTMQDIAARMGKTVSQILRAEKTVVFQTTRKEHFDRYIGDVVLYDIQAISNGEIVLTINDVFVNAEVAEEFVNLCNNGNLSLVHLCDIIYDYLERE